MAIVSRVFLLFLLCFARPLVAENTTVFIFTVDKPLDEVYSKVYDALEDARFFVVKELDIGNSLSNFAEKWGDEYNQSGLAQIRSMVFCNGWYANQVSNKDPHMLGLCPLHMTLIEKAGKTTALFNRPTAIAVNSPALEVLTTIELDVINAIKKGMH